MSYQHDDDLFEETKMTFGEHLEELRSSLFKALMALMIGFSIGLYYGSDVVRWLQVPVVRALERYQTERAVLELEAQLREEGKEVPKKPVLRAMVAQEKMVAEQIYLDPREVLAALKVHYEGAMDDVSLPDSPARSDSGQESNPGPKRNDLVQVKLWKPTSNSEARMITLNAQEAFMIWIKAALVAGALLSSPLIFYFVWSFVASGLYPHEKKYVYIFLPFSFALFAAGAALAFAVVFGYVLDFLFTFNLRLNIQPELRISEWLGFVLLLPLGFGVSFQLPLVMLFLERIGVFTTSNYLDKWRLAVLVIALIAMVLTPADPMSMVLMAAPLTLLYFGGILLCHFWPRKSNPFEVA